VNLSSIDIAGLISSRICHDVISPIGAIDNGLELLGMAGGFDGPEMELISESAQNASARIRFFRVAFGAAAEQLMGPAEVSSIVSDLHRGSRLSVDWSVQEPQPRRAVRQAFNGLLCLETAMPYGGDISIERQNDQWCLTARAEKLNVDEALWGRLAGQPGSEPLLPAQVQFALLPLIAEEDGRAITMRSDDTSLRLMI
jgi:histidine phosphotransferase ChpT